MELAPSRASDLSLIARSRAPALGDQECPFAPIGAIWAEAPTWPLDGKCGSRALGGGRRAGPGARTRLHKRAGLPDRIKSRRQALGVHRHDSADADADRRERIWAIAPARSTGLPAVQDPGRA